MKNIFLLCILSFAFYSCNVEELETYNSDFTGEWQTKSYFYISKGDSARNYFTIAGKNSAFGLGCKTNEAFKNCLYYEVGKVKYNKKAQAIQVGNSVQQVHNVHQEPFINSEGKWEMMIDSVRYFKE